MKKYQNWLDTQLYNNHLVNLAQIKRRREEKFSVRCQTSYPKHSSHEGFLIYNNQKNSLRAKDVKSMCKDYFIQKQNLSYLKRVKNVPPVISKDKLMKEYKKSHWIIRRKAKKLDEYQVERDKKLLSFFKIREDKHRKGIHKYIMKINFHSLPKVPFGDFASYWIQLTTHEEKVASQHINSEQIFEKKFYLMLRYNPKNNGVLKIHYCRGLDYFQVGEFSLFFPPLAQEKNYKLKSSKNTQKKIQFSMVLNEINPSKHV